MSQETENRGGEHVVPQEGSPEPRPDGRLWGIFAVGALIWGLAWAAFDIPIVEAALAVMGMIGAAATMTRYAPKVIEGRPQVTGQAFPVWPETGMKMLLDALDEAAFLTDAEGIVRFQNRAAKDSFGITRAGDPLSFRLRVPEVLEALSKACNGGVAEPVRFVLRGPSERHMTATCKALHRPKHATRQRPDFVLVHFHDDTEMVRVDRMRGDFIANASHELRTPLASLTGFIETLLGPARKDEQNRERFLKIMLEQAQRMGRLIDDLLSLTRVEMRAHQRPTGRIDLRDMVARGADMLTPVAGQRQATISVHLPDAPALVVGDHDELLQVLTNLVENAIKYGREGGTVGVRVEGETDVAGEPGWALSVSDDGPGIAPEHLPRLTERFYRVDAARSREQKGTGLGLAIVKHILNRHQGLMKIRSEVGVGTEVHIWLPSAQGSSDK
ncbi:ATP-binding protein [Oryzibacter oryziterrae]|uniref:ATP-binding protein n=1 Tax=Oryzibacter oryziterrae TaxID=2766474 RepID=UPI001F39B518|nr:ATP-binding protein [Oryzibacter oryziterrae]